MIIQGKVWGHTTPLFDMNNVELHIAEVKKGGYCSKHAHAHKYNRFIVLKGKLRVIIWKEYNNRTLEDISILGASQECTVGPGDFHKFEALEDTTVLEVYWVELKKDDIIRKDHGGLVDETKAITTSAESGDYGYGSANCGLRKAVMHDNITPYAHTPYFGSDS